MNETEQLLASDSRGRVRYSAERRELLLDEFERSGVSAAMFARTMGLKYPTFASWVAKRRRQTGSGAPVTHQGPVDGALRWVEAVVGGPEPALIVELPGGVRLRVSNASQAALAAQLVRQLGGVAAAVAC